MNWIKKVADWEIAGDEVIFYDGEGKEINRTPLNELIEFYLEEMGNYLE